MIVGPREHYKVMERFLEALMTANRLNPNRICQSCTIIAVRDFPTNARHYHRYSFTETLLFCAQLGASILSPVFFYLGL